MTGKYQLLDPLSEQQLADLREDIEEVGVLQPVVVDESGEVIDGHHRKQIAEELGINYPTHKLEGLSEQQKFDHSLRLNLMGRHQSSEQKRETIKRYLLRRPEAANKHVARIIGCSDHTVAKVRAELEATAQIARLTERVASDGKIRPARTKPKAQVKAEAEAKRAEQQAKREEQLAKQRAKAAEKRAAEKAEEDAFIVETRERHEAIGGAVSEHSRVPPRVRSAQERINHFLSEAVVSLMRAIDDPGFGREFVEWDQQQPKDFRAQGQTKKARALLKEFDDKLKRLKVIDKASDAVSESPARE